MVLGNPRGTGKYNMERNVILSFFGAKFERV